MKHKILKICGIRKPLSNYYGIDMLGFNFIEISKRKITTQQAKNIKTPPSVMRIGLFGRYDKQNKLWCDLSEEETDKIIETAKETNMKGVQAYGVTNFDKFKQAGLYTICPINHNEIISSPLATIIGDLSEEDLENIDLLIIDSSNPGSGVGYDYSKLGEMKLKKPFFVAGGVDKNSISEIFEQVPNCIGVDIASGVDNGENVDEEMVREVLERIGGN